MAQVDIQNRQHLASIIRNRGYDVLDRKEVAMGDVIRAAERFDGDVRDGKIKIEDAIHTGDVQPLMPHTMVEIIKESQEPLLIGTNLLDRINHRAGQTIVFPAIGALTAADVAEGQEYPEVTPQIGGATVTATVSKSGLAFAITEEVMRYSQWDILGLLLRECGKALARRKEVKIFNYIKAMGVVTHDNLYPTDSMFGTTTGRALDGSGNGSLVMEDVFDAYSQIIMQGFIPDTILMHPLTYVMWVKDPVLRAFALAWGGGTWFATYSGNPAGRAPWDSSNDRSLGVATGQNVNPGGSALGSALAASGESASGLNEYSQVTDSRPNVPNYFPWPMRILVSPFMPFDPGSRSTDLYMFDSSRLGALIVDEELTTEEWSDPSNDTRKVKLRERYGIGIYEEGQAIAVIRNLSVKPNEVVLPATATQSVSGNISELDRTSAITL